MEHMEHMKEAVEKTRKALIRKRYQVSVFETAEEAAQYVDASIDQKTVGFGDSRTMADMGLYRRLRSHNTVYDPYQSKDNDEFLDLARKAMLTDVFLTSVNGMAQTGEMVNIDGTGNRIAGSLFGHEKVFFIVSANKIEPDLDRAMYRARNVAAPLNALKYNLPTPCVKSGEHRCFNCNTEGKICNAIVVHHAKMNDIDDVEVVLIMEEMGF